ncbi:MAG TPA: aspartate--tRNA(Asn) ligase [Candidatus Nanoarchaeia archaeon]|nr:aspartate--tRNA(Asn) ligase [Candidatus Nanoarchaeia archaeon]
MVKQPKAEKKEKSEELDLVEFNKNRSYIKDVLDGKKTKAEIVGWVHNTRALGKIRFIILRDISGLIQITAVKGEISENLFNLMDSFSRESVIYVKGSVKDSKQAPGGKEIIPEEIIELAHAEDLPIDVSDFSKTELPKRLDYRFLDLHRRRIQAIFNVQSTIQEAYIEFMNKEKAVFAQFPSIISSSSEGGTELFEAKYFEKKAFLSQSCQLYKQMLACSIEKVFTIFTVWRAEKHNTVRHLNESRQLDFEMAFADEFVVMDVLARCVQHIVKNVIEKNKEELDLLGVKIKVPSVKYLAFKEVSEIMKKHKIHISKDDLSGDVEKKLGELYADAIVFVYDWPLSGKPFYIMPKGTDLSRGFDAIYQGMEISSGGQRVHIPELLIERLKVKGLNPKDFKSYVDSFRYGAPPHAGWGVGLERLTMLILRLNNIREAVLFPRDRDRLTP